MKYSIDEMNIVEDNVPNNYKTASLTMTAENLDEWGQLLKLYEDIICFEDWQVPMIKKTETSRQIQIRIDQARSREEEEDNYDD